MRSPALSRLALLGILACGGPALAQPGTAPQPHARAMAQLEALYAGGDLPAAIDAGKALLKQALTADERVTVLNYLGACCYQLARFGDGISYLQQALTLLPAGHDRGVDRASLLNDLGECQRAAGRFQTAVQTLDQALAGVVQAAPRSELHARILNNIAGLARDRGDFTRTQQLLEEALQITESAEGISGDRLATAHLNLAELLRYQSRLQEARPHYEAALRIARTAYPPTHPNLVYFLNQFALLRSEQAEFASADTLRQEALRILDAQDEASYPLLRAMMLSDTATDLLAQGHPLQATQLLQRALALRRASYAAGHWELGATLGQLARAELEAKSTSASGVAARATEAIDILDRTPVAPESRADAYAVRALARLAGTGNRAAAAQDLERAIELVEQLRVRRGGGDESRARLLARYASYYDAAIDLALREGAVARAVDYAERFRARALEEQLALDRQRLVAAIDPSERDRLLSEAATAESKLVSLQDQQMQLAYDPVLPDAQRNSKAARLQADLESAVRAYTACQERIRSRSPAWRSLVGRRDVAALPVIQSQLTAGELLLLYWVGPAHGWVMEIPPAPAAPRACALTVDPADAAALGLAPGALTQADLSAVLSPSARGFGAGPLFEPVRGVAGLTDLPQLADSTAAPPVPTSIPARLHALWKVLAPADSWAQIQAAHAVTIVPAGPLHQLPFEALVTGWSAGGAPRFWLDDGPPLRYAVSATTWLQLQRASRGARSYPRVDVLSVSNPALGPGDTGAAPGQRARDAGTLLRGADWSHLPALPGTERESALVQEAFGPGRVQVLSGQAASEAAVRAQCADKRYLHLATHGVVDEATSDVLAGLVLARAGAQPGADGRLQLYEIDGLRLSAQLAVLSACRTAAGKQIESEGVFALARGFHIAGALRVVASLWSVSDASTATLMGEFFQRIAKAERTGIPVDYASALRDAKRAVRSQAQWSQPFYWAPFLLSGAR